MHAETLGIHSSTSRK